MAFSICRTLNVNIDSGVSARANNRSAAGNVVESFVRRLNKQEIKTRKGLFHLFPTSVTEGSGSPLIASFKDATVVRMLEFETVMSTRVLKVTGFRNSRSRLISVYTEHGLKL